MGPFREISPHRINNLAGFRVAGERRNCIAARDGTFQSPRATPVFNSAQVVVGDFNKDGKLDVVAAGQALLGNGEGTFQATDSFVTAFCYGGGSEQRRNPDMVGFG